MAIVHENVLISRRIDVDTTLAKKIAVAATNNGNKENSSPSSRRHKIHTIRSPREIEAPLPVVCLLACPS